jgi:molybdopterin molybdotransferase
LAIERVVDRGDTVTVKTCVVTGDNVRPAGGDTAAQAEVLPAGTRLAPAHLAALAACGIAEVRCARRPRVSVLVTGTELRAPGSVLSEGQIYESNATMLAALLTAAGGTVERHAPVEDDEPAHRAALERALVANVLVSSGGVSVGPHDLVRRVEAELGVEEVFWGVAMRPGKPLAFGVRGSTLVLGLPGNPVSALVGALLFVRPALLALQGAADPEPRWHHGELGSPVLRNPSRDDFPRARSRPASHATVLEPITGQESHMIVRAAGADAIVHVPRGDGEIAAGSAVRYLPLTGHDG